MSEANNSVIAGAKSAETLLQAVGEQLAAAGERFDIVVVGGSALLVLGLTRRPTGDVDLVALMQDDAVTPADPLPDALAESSRLVARDFDLPENWLNGGPTSLLDFGLPERFMERCEIRDYGGALTVRFASRLDQIHLKLYAMVDRGPGRHEQDLRALEPAREELIAAARWTRSHDPSEGYLGELRSALAHLGVEDAELDA